MDLLTIARAAGIDEIPSDWAALYPEAQAVYAPFTISDEALKYVPEELLTAVRAACDHICADEALSRLCAFCRYMAFDRAPEHWFQGKQWPFPNEQSHGPLFYAIVILANYENVKEIYRARGIATDILEATLIDLAVNMRACKVLFGRDGLIGGRFWWMTLHFSAKIFRIGRLQFAHSTRDKRIDAEDGSFLEAGAPVLEVHIAAGEPLNYDACEASYARAHAFYRDHFPEVKYEALTCDSWLLDPELQKILPPASNIIRFQSKFKRGARSQKDESVFEYVYGGKPDDLHLLQEDTYLRRAIKKLYLSGGAIRMTAGFMR